MLDISQFGVFRREEENSASLYTLWYHENICIAHGWKECYALVIRIEMHVQAIFNCQQGIGWWQQYYVDEIYVVWRRREIR